MFCPDCGLANLNPTPTYYRYHWCYHCAKFVVPPEDQPVKEEEPTEEKLDYTQRPPRGGWF